MPYSMKLTDFRPSTRRGVPPILSDAITGRVRAIRRFLRPQPVLVPEPGHVLEVASVAGDERGLLCQHRRRNELAAVVALAKAFRSDLRNCLVGARETV